MTRMTGPDCVVMCNLINTHTHTHTHTHLIPPWEDQCEWHRTARITGPDCAVMCNLINTHTHTHNPRKEASPIRRPGIKYSSPAHCAHVKRLTRVQLPVLQPTNARLSPGRGTAFLKNSGDRCKRHAARIGTVSVTNAVTFT